MNIERIEYCVWVTINKMGTYFTIEPKVQKNI